MRKKHPKNPGVAFSLNDFSKTHSICELQMQLENPDYPFAAFVNSQRDRFPDNPLITLVFSFLFFFLWIPRLQFNVLSRKLGAAFV